VINIKTKITDEFIGKYAKLKVGFASGLIGLIEKNVEGIGVSPYIHVTKSGIKTGVIFQEDIEVVEI
jgi:hypothetical protein